MDTTNEILIRVSKNEISYMMSLRNVPTRSFPVEKYDLEVSIAKIFHRVLNVYNIIDKEKQIFDEGDYRILGNSLKKILFEDDGTMESKKVVDKVMDKFQTIFLSPGDRFRVYLEFEPEAGKVGILPWEYLLLTVKKVKGTVEKEIPIYLAADKQFDLIRSIRVYEKFEPPQPVDKLNVIIITSNCLGQLYIDKFNFDEWARTLKNQNPGAIEFYPLEQPLWGKNQDDFTKRLNKIVSSLQGQPYILHYLGHARLETERGEITFVGDQQQAVWIDDQKFADLIDINDQPLPHLVILQACSSGRIEIKQKDPNRPTEVEFCGVGVKLAMNGVPAVVAMQNDVSEADSTAFLTKFYESLISGDDVAEAVTNGRIYLATDYKSEHKDGHFTNIYGTPVLFLSTPEPFGFMKKQRNLVEEKVESYRLCRTCFERFENIPGNRHETHDTIPTTREEYVEDQKKLIAASVARSDVLSFAAPSNREEDLKIRSSVSANTPRGPETTVTIDPTIREDELRNARDNKD